MPRLIVLDASAMINVLGCGSPQRILGAFKGQCALEEHTLMEVIRDPFTGTPAQPQLDRLFAHGALVKQKMSDSAYAHYLSLVSSSSRDALGRGESAALAHANDVGALVVLDDLKARRIGRARFRECDQWSSVDIFRTAADLLKLTKRETAVLVGLAHEKARMHIHDHDRSWVASLTRPSGDRPVRAM